MNKENLMALDLRPVMIKLKRRFYGISSKVRELIHCAFDFSGRDSSKTRIRTNTKDKATSTGMIGKRAEMLNETVLIGRERALPIYFVKLVLRRR